MNRPSKRIRKMRRALPMRINGDFEILNAELWWMDLQRVTFWAEKRLVSAESPRARVLLDDRGEYVDITCNIRAVRRSVDAGPFWLCIFRDYSVLDPAEREFLLERLRLINPAVAKELERLKTEAQSIPCLSTPKSPGEPSSTTASTADKGREASTPSPAGESPVRFPGLSVMVSDGRPPSLFLQFKSRQALVQCAVIDAVVHIQIPLEPSLQNEATVLTVLQIPPGLFIQTTGAVNVDSSSTMLIQFAK